MQRFSERLKRIVMGAPVSSDLNKPSTLRTRLALPVFGAGVLAAVAYGPDAVLDALRRGEVLSAAPLIAAGTVALLLLLGLAFSSQVRAFPHERGDYGVVKDKLGASPSMITGASLLIDYLFTVAISVAAVAEMIAYLVPQWQDWVRLLAVAPLAAMTFAQLRGVRDRSRVVLVVFYGFLAVIVTVVVFAVLNPEALAHMPVREAQATNLSALTAIAGAIASGAVMATGLEHLAASGPYHAEPRGKRTSRTLLFAVVAGSAAFFAVIALAWRFGVSGYQDGALLLQVTRTAVPWEGASWVVAIAAAAILYAAAASVFRRFARLTGLLATDGVLPRQMSMRNDRMVQRGSVLLVAGLSAAIVVGTGASVEQLVHMYIVGVFTAIVLGQRAMMTWAANKLQVATSTRDKWEYRARLVLHAAAMVVSGAVLAVTAVFNFANGAWLALVLIVIVVVLMHGIKRHYEAVRRDIALDKESMAPTLPSATHGIVLVAQLHRPALHALSYAKAARHSTLKAVTVTMDRGASLALQKRWAAMDLGAPLVVLDSPYRDLVAPTLQYVKDLRMASPREAVYVYVPEYIVGRWWEQLLHNRNTARLRAQLLNVPNVVVSAVPWMLESARREGPLDDVLNEGVELP